MTLALSPYSEAQEPPHLSPARDPVQSCARSRSQAQGQVPCAARAQQHRPEEAGHTRWCAYSHARVKTSPTIVATAAGPNVPIFCRTRERLQMAPVGVPRDPSRVCKLPRQRWRQAAGYEAVMDTTALGDAGLSGCACPQLQSSGRCRAAIYHGVDNMHTVSQKEYTRGQQPTPRLLVILIRTGREGSAPPPRRCDRRSRF